MASIVGPSCLGWRYAQGAADGRMQENEVVEWTAPYQTAGGGRRYEMFVQGAGAPFSGLNDTSSNFKKILVPSK